KDIAQSYKRLSGYFVKEKFEKGFHGLVVNLKHQRCLPELIFLITFNAQHLIYISKSRKQFWFAVNQRHIMFKMGAWPSIIGYYRPTIFELFHFVCSQINHGFNSDRHSFNKFLSSASFSVIGYFRVFM